MSKKAKSNILLLITAIIWGSAFVAQKAGTTLEPFTYNGIRTLIGGIALLPVIAVFSGRGGSGGAESPSAGGRSDGAAPGGRSQSRRDLIMGGVCCGLVLFVASTLQQFGMYFDTDAGKAGFITALYIVIVPILGVFIKKKIRPLIWFCVLLGAVGFYMLTMAGKGSGFDLQLGDLFCLLCAIAFSVHILVIDHFSPKCDGVKMSCIQFFVAGGVSCLLMFFLDPALGFSLPTLADLQAGWFPLFYAGVMSCGVAYTFQVVAQADVNPTLASMLLCLESVFAVLAGAVILGEGLGLREIIGCLLMFAAIVVAQLPGKDEQENPDKLKG